MAVKIYKSINKTAFEVYEGGGLTYKRVYDSLDYTFQNNRYNLFKNSIPIDNGIGLLFSDFLDSSDTPYLSDAALQADLDDVTGKNGGGVGSVPITQQATQYSNLVAGTSIGQIAYVENSEGTAWLPSTLGGTYYPAGFYLWNGSDWVSDRNAIAKQLADNIIDISNNSNEIDQEILDRESGDQGTVTIHSDVSNAGSGQIITTIERANLSNQSGTNTGDETTASIQSKRPLKTVDGQSLEGSGDIPISSSGVQSVTGDGVGGTATDVVLTFPNASEVANAFDKSTDDASDITMASSTQTVQNKIVNIQNETDANTEICTSATSFMSTLSQSVGTQGNSAGTNIQINLTNILGANNLTYGLSSGSVTIPVAGWYKVSFKSLTQTSTNNRQNTAFVVKRNLVNIAGTLAAGYNRNPGNNDASAAIPNVIPQFQFALGDTIGLYAIVQGDGNQASSTISQECILTLEFIGS